jgi:ABC-type polysaccharide/polyol phosphate transport system ATPase subunit
LPTLPDGSIRVEQVWKKFLADRVQPQFTEHLIHLRRRLTEGREKQWRWVLKDINFEVEPGGTLALIGINGSGKTTMLKILSRVTYQTAGVCNVQGRIGALLSVTSGLHPELSGRENVFLYGTVLGMGREKIRDEFDDIVEFAGVGDAIDRPVKFYSSGMQVRLGFAIAAFLEPDILLVDEVLSVGDANFQQKCLNRIGEIVQRGTTLLYVSHDLASVEASCERAVWLANAEVRAVGPTKEVLALYRASLKENAASITGNQGIVDVLKADVQAADGGSLRSEHAVDVCLTLRSPEADRANFFVGISQGTAFPMFLVEYEGFMPQGDFELRCRLNYLPLPKGRYSAWAAITGYPRGKRDPFLPWQPVVTFDSFGPDRVKTPQGVMGLSPIYVGAAWSIE